METKDPSAEWSPPTGLPVMQVAAGRYWDAVIVPEDPLGRQVLERLGEESGAVIRDPYGPRLTWLIRPGATAGWDVPAISGVQLLSTAQYLSVPPAWSTSAGSSVHWLRRWCEHGRTDAALLRVVLDAVLSQAYPRHEKAVSS